MKQNHVNGDTKSAPHILRQLKKNTEKIKRGTSGHYKRAEKGRQLEPKHAEALFKDILSQINRIKDEGIDTTLHYRVDFMVHIEEVAVENFCRNQKAYEQHRCPIKLLEKKREAYHKIFRVATGKEDPVVVFSTILLKLVYENLEDRITFTGLLNILRNHRGDAFRSAEALQASSIMTRWSQNGIMEYSFSIAQYEEIIKKTITEKSVACFEDKNYLKTYAKSGLHAIVTELKDAAVKTIQSSCDSEDFIGTLFSNMNGLKKPHNDIEAYKMLKVNDKNQFTSSLIDQLMGPIHQQLKKDIESWSIARTIERKGFTEFVFKDIIGCLFCQIQRNSVFEVENSSYLCYILLDDCLHQKELKTHNCNEISDSTVEGHSIKIHLR